MAPQSSLLSPSNYDNDASSLHSDQGHRDADSDDDATLTSRTSGEIRDHDREVLQEEEEMDRLVEETRSGRAGNTRGQAGFTVPSAVKNLFQGQYAAVQSGDNYAHDDQQELDDEKGSATTRADKRRARKQRRRQKKEQLMEQAEKGETGELMQELEEGTMKDGSETGESSDTDMSDMSELKMDEKIAMRKRSKGLRCGWFCLIYALIAGIFVVLVLIAWSLSAARNKSMAQGQTLFNNGTAVFAPTTILISLDGFRADFLNRGLTPRLNAFIKEGVSPKYMLPSFPSVTFPNHYTLVTGLYPESHGVIGNTFWDPELQEEFYYTDPLRSMQSKWWGGEPLWATAEKQGIRTAIHMWPGSEAHIMNPEPSFVDTYNGKEELSNKVSRILELLDKPGRESPHVAIAETRPQLIAAYVPNVDVDGHKFGPNSTEIRATIHGVDTMLDQLFQGLESRNLTGVVNVVVVSDHGMATTSTDRLIQLESLLDTSLVEHTDGWPLYGLRPRDPAGLQALYQHLFASALAHDGFDVYLRDANMPERYHFSRNERIAPLWIVPRTGWAIVTMDEFDVEKAKKDGTVYHPRGLHGYDHEHPLMRAIFVARGPAFPHAPNSRVEVFQNTEVYNIICDSLHLSPNANNGTLRLPLVPIGQHDDAPSAAETPDDPPVSSSSSAMTASKTSFPSSTPSASGTSTSTSDDEELADAVISISPIEASSAADPDERPPVLVGVDDADANADPDARPVVGDENQMTAEEKAEAEEKNFWDFIMGEIEGWKEWIEGLGREQQTGKNATETED